VRDASFALTAAQRACPPFAFELAASRPDDRDRWRVRDALGFVVGYAPTRAGARAALLALYAVSP
jgi:hypothetical protein